MNAARLTCELRLSRGDFALDLNLDLAASGVTALFGASGCGKTTVLRSLAGLEPTVKGRVALDGATWLDTGNGLSVPTHQRAVGYVFQESALFPHTTVRGNLHFAWTRTPAARRTLDVNAMADRTAISHLLDRRIDGLSGGERQRVAIARALLTGPRLLLLDEPLASLDAAGKADLLAFLAELRRETDVPVVYVTHQVEEVARLADHVLLMDAGRLVDRGPVAEMLGRLSLHASPEQRSLAVIDATVSAHDPEYGIARMDFDGGRLEVPLATPPVTWEARLCVDAANVSITRTRAEDSSILNRLEAVVEAIDVLDRGHVLVRCRVGETLVPALITRFSADSLDLAVGSPCVVQIKAVAIT